MNVSWKTYVDQRFSDNDKALRAALEAAEKKAEKLAAELSDYKAQANEWRGAMTDKDVRFSLNQDTERIEGDVKKLQLWEAKLSGMATQADVNKAYMIAVISALGAIISMGIGITAIIFN